MSATDAPLLHPAFVRRVVAPAAMRWTSAQCGSGASGSRWRPPTGGAARRRRGADCGRPGETGVPVRALQGGRARRGGDAVGPRRCRKPTRSWRRRAISTSAADYERVVCAARAGRLRADAIRTADGRSVAVRACGGGMDPRTSWPRSSARPWRGAVAVLTARWSRSTLSCRWWWRDAVAFVTAGRVALRWLIPRRRLSRARATQRTSTAAGTSGFGVAGGPVSGRRYHR